MESKQDERDEARHRLWHMQHRPTTAMFWLQRAAVRRGRSAARQINARCMQTSCKSSGGREARGAGGERKIKRERKREKERYKESDRERERE